MPPRSRRARAIAILLVTTVAGCAAERSDATTEHPREPASLDRGVICPEGTRMQGAAPPDGAAAWCERPDGRKHGPSREWTTDGRLVAEGEYEGGERDGTWRTFHGNGVPRTSGDYARGETIGTWYEWDAEGAPVGRFVYEAGGHQVQETRWWPSVLKSRSTTRDGVLHGRIVEHDAQGKLVRDAEYDSGTLVRDNLGSSSEVPVVIGVPDCDTYLANYRRCIDTKLPEAVREPSLQALEQTIEAWRQVAQVPAGREGLVQACRAAADAVKAACSD